MSFAILPALVPLALVVTALQPPILLPLLRDLWLWRRRSALVLLWRRLWNGKRGAALRPRAPGLFVDAALASLLAATLSAAALPPVSGSADVPVAIVFWMRAGGLAVNLMILTIIDLRWLRLPDRITLPLAAIGLADAALTDRLATSFFSGVVLVLLLLSLRAAALRLKGTEGLGLGDVKFAGAIGIWLGPDWSAPALFAAALFGITGHLLDRLLSDRATAQQPFGPSLASAFWIAFLCQSAGLSAPAWPIASP
ncbi:hypothetical protein BJF93_12780 [Xaviernesmea oryzae]|uniref:Prepilin type IV endopeptidase peptidase domain-containing protein n=1 Tax=Xaviernesmea oryzae TaxID=464029 RepID=A0A1Q9AQL9_9HYPH|nr:A24 family peptidase [Xaviernesmea oryzae]OLP57737.1 hypothetical protein BJF93_12780 [Xaviernesmea oryzae]SEM06186.1 Type IV leader peptidase family protein [Xaviernesmea oryzae]